ncbi:MAG: hypothetical protein Q9213_005754, partial [Squamulea squamosa]
MSDDAYLAFAELSPMEVAMDSFDVGESFDVKFEIPAPMRKTMLSTEGRELTFMTMNSAQRRTPLGTRNLTFLLHRPKTASDRVINYNNEASHDMDTELVHFLPQNSNLSARRTMNAINAVHAGKAEKYHSLRRFLMGQSSTVFQPFDFFDHNELLKSKSMQRLFRLLCKDQQEALYDLMKKDFIAFILGPPGIGESYFNVILALMLSEKRQKSLMAFPSNGPVDELIFKFLREAPGLKVVRYHNLHFERSATVKEANLRRSKQDTSDPVEGKAGISESTEADQDTYELRRAYASAVAHARKLAKANKSTRPHMSFKSLHAWILDAIDNRRADEDPSITHFRQVFNGDPKADWGEEGYSEVYNTAQRNAEAHILGAASVVVTTLSNSSDRFLAQHFHPDIGIIDEAANAIEPELLIMLTNFMNSVRFWVGVGDPNQLRAVATSAGQVLDDGLIANPFVKSYSQSLMERRKHLGDSIFASSVNLRVTAGLEQPCSKLFYGGSLVPDASCALAKRPVSQAFIKYVHSRLPVKLKVPRLVLHIEQSVSMKDTTQSRHNPFNIAATLQEIHVLFKAGIFKAKDTCIEYRKALRRADSAFDWRGLSPSDMRLKTIDSLQGGEAPLIAL